MRTKVCHYAPSSEGALRKGGKPPGLDWGGGRAVPWNFGERTWGNPAWGTWPARERTLRTVIFRDGISRWEFEGEPGTEPWDTEPRDTRDTRLNASQDGFRGETVRENPEGRKGGRVSRVRSRTSLCHISGGVQKRTPSWCPESLGLREILADRAPSCASTPPTLLGLRERLVGRGGH